MAPYLMLLRWQRVCFVDTGNHPRTLYTLNTTLPLSHNPDLDRQCSFSHPACFVFFLKQQLWSYFKGPKKHFQKGRGLLCMVCFRGIGDRGWDHWFGGLIAQWGIYRVPWDKKWVTGSLWTQAKEETKALESRVSLFTQTASFLFSCSNSNCYSMLKAHGFLFSKMKSEQIQNPGGGIFSLSHTASLPWPRHPASP